MFKKTNMDKFNQAYLRIIAECKRNSKKSVIRQGINENFHTVFDDVIEPGKFYRLLGSWTPDSYGRNFSSVYGSVTSKFLEIQDPTNENLQNYFNDVINLINNGFIEIYYQHDAELYIAGSFKNLNYNTRNSLFKSEFFDFIHRDQYEYVKEALRQVSEEQFLSEKELALNIIQEEKQFLLNIQKWQNRSVSFNDSDTLWPRI